MRGFGTLLISILFAIALQPGCDGRSDDATSEEGIDVDVEIGESEAGQDDGSGSANEDPEDDADQGSDENQTVLDRPVSEGSWLYRETPTGGMAIFGEPETEGIFSVRCEEQTLHFDRAAASEPVGRVEMTIYTSEGNTRIEATPVGTEIPLLRASLPVEDSWVHRLVDARGNIAVAVNGGEPLVMPHSEALSHVLRECGRSGADPADSR